MILGLFVHGADGLLIRAEAFEPDREDEALGRFDALVSEAERRGAPTS